MHGAGETMRALVDDILDVAKMETPDAPAETAGERGDGLLLVEGNPLTQGMMRNLLEPHFARLRCVADGDGAIAAIDAGSERQMLVEARSATMPDLAPLEALRRLVAHGQARGMHVTVLLTPSDHFPIEAALAIGADQLVLKPVSGTQLLKQLLIQDAVPAAVAQAA